MAVKGLIHYALEVPDPAVGAAFYRDFGLQGSERHGNSLQLETSRGAGGLQLFEGPRKRLHHVAFAAPGDHFEAVRAALKRDGIPEIDPPQETSGPCRRERLLADVMGDRERGGWKCYSCDTVALDHAEGYGLMRAVMLAGGSKHDDPASQSKSGGYLGFRRRGL
jgi:catechol 2,3-dioxygenase-like lactoylglutathione lyase family enzyme